MGKRLQVWAGTDEERQAVTRLAHRPSAGRRAGAGCAGGASGRHRRGDCASFLNGVSEKVVRQWLKRFAETGLEGWEDAPRSGRPPTYPPEVVNQVIAKARSLPPKPTEGELPPTCHWTLDRLQAEFAKDGIPIKRSQIRWLLKAEHINWQKPWTWLESPDPDFAEKRGSSSTSTPIHLLAVR